MNFCGNCGYQINGAPVCENCGALSGAQTGAQAFVAPEQQAVPSSQPASGYPEQAGFGVSSTGNPPVSQSAFVQEARALPSVVWRRALLHGVIGYLAVLVVAMIVAVLLIGALDASGLSSYVSFGTGGFLTLGIQLVNMAFFGEVSGAVGSLVFVPVLILVAFVCVVFSVARIFLPVGEIRSVGLRVLVSAIPGVIVAALSTITAALFPAPYSVGTSFSLLSVSVSSSLSSVSFFSFVMAFLVTSAAVFFANTPKGAVTARFGFPALGEQLGAALRAASGYVLLLGVVGLVAVPFWIAAQYPNNFGALMLSLPFDGLTLVLWAVGLISLGSITFSAGAGSYGSTSSTASIFSASAWSVILAVLVLILAILVAAAILYAARRGTIPHPVSWAITPAVFLVLGLGVQLFTTAWFSVSISYVTVSGSLGLSGWTFVFFGVWGVLVEMMAQFVLPVLVRNLGHGVMGWLVSRLPEATSQAIAVASVSEAPYVQQPGEYYGQPGYSPEGFAPQQAGFPEMFDSGNVQQPQYSGSSQTAYSPAPAVPAPGEVLGDPEQQEPSGVPSSVDADQKSDGAPQSSEGSSSVDSRRDYPPQS